MKWFKRSFSYVVRHKYRSVILFLIIFILGNVISSAVSLNQMSSFIALEIKRQLGSTATYINEEINASTYTIATQADLDDLKRYETIVNSLINSKYVNYGNYSYMMNLKSSDGQMCYGYGVSHVPLADVKENVIQITEGREFKKEELEKGEYVVLVADDFMINDHKVNLNDNIEMVLEFKESVYNENGIYEDRIIYQEKYQLQVVGIFKKIDKAFDHTNIEFNNVSQRMYMPNKTLWELFERKHELIQQLDTFEVEHIAIDPPVIRLKDSNDLQAFEEEAKSMILPRIIKDPLLKLPEEKLITSDDEYQSVSKPVAVLEQFGSLLTAGGIIAFSVILCFVLTAMVKERIYEIGIYMALGEKKVHILMQLFCEMLLVGILSLSFSIISGYQLGTKITDYLFGSQQTIIELEDMPDNKLDGDYLVKVYALSGMTMVISLIYPSFCMWRYDPKEILTQ